MPNITDIKQLIGDLHERKIVNANTTLAEIVALQAHIVNPGAEVGWYVVGGDHYVVVCGMEKLAREAGGNPFGR